MPFAGDLELIANDIKRQSNLLRDARSWSRESSRSTAAKTPPANRVYLVGCGDSYDAAGAAQLLWQRLLGSTTQAMTALAFSRYAVDTAPADSLLVALSQSGRVSRVIEAVRLACQRGIRTIAITGSKVSPLADEGDLQIVSSFPKLGSIPGTSSYVLNMALLIELAVELADAWRVPADTDRIRTQLAQLPDLIDRSVTEVWSTAKAHALATAHREVVQFAVGSGPNLATARFFARKASEIPQVAVLAQEGEEFAHDQYSIVQSGSPVLMCSPPGASAGRDDELLTSLAKLSAVTAVVTDVTRTLPAEAKPVWRYDVAPGLDESLTPLLYSLPAQTYSYELAKLIGGSFYAFASEVHRSEGDRLIYESAMVDHVQSR